MAAKYRLLIDESGEAGIAKVRTASSGGASPYMTLGGVIIRNSDAGKLEDTLQEISATLKKPLHCVGLNHSQKVFYARTIAAQPVRLFGVASLKSTLKWYKANIDGDSKKYYNKCAQYLLERVGMFMEARNIDKNDLDIVFEEANCDYDGLGNLIRTCQRNPHHPNTQKLQNISARRISAKAKADEPLLQIADLAAHALYKCVDKQPANYHIPEPRYIKELESRFYGDPETNKVVNAGIYCVHSLSALKLDEDVQATLSALKTKPFKRS